MKDSELAKMPVVQLWHRHERSFSSLTENCCKNRAGFSIALMNFGRKFGGSPSDVPQRRPYPKVRTKVS